MKTVKPMHDYVLIKMDEKEEKTKGGIIIPGELVEESTTGVIKAVGPGNFSERLERFVRPYSEVGMKVIFSKYGNTEITLEDGVYCLIPERSISGIVVE